MEINKKQKAIYDKLYRKKNKRIIQIKLKEKLKQRPWWYIYFNAKQRCNNPDNHAYKWYGARGIKFFLTQKEIEKLWFRDKACLLKQPSIDREDNDGNYEYDNCQFIERNINSGKDKRKIILQFDIQGDFIQKWESITEASKKLKLHTSNLVRTCRGDIGYKTCGGFKWEYNLTNK